MEVNLEPTSSHSYRHPHLNKQQNSTLLHNQHERTHLHHQQPGGGTRYFHSIPSHTATPPASIQIVENVQSATELSSTGHSSTAHPSDGHSTTISPAKKKNLELQRQHEKDQNVMLPLITFLLSFFLPPVGCIGFMLCIRSKYKTPRYRWALRSLYLGCALSCIYIFVISSLVGHWQN